MRWTRARSTGSSNRSTKSNSRECEASFPAALPVCWRNEDWRGNVVRARRNKTSSRRPGPPGSAVLLELSTPRGDHLPPAVPLDPISGIHVVLPLAAVPPVGEVQPALVRVLRVGLVVEAREQVDVARAFAGCFVEQVVGRGREHPLRRAVVALFVQLMPSVEVKRYIRTRSHRRSGGENAVASITYFFNRGSYTIVPLASSVPACSPNSLSSARTGVLPASSFLSWAVVCAIDRVGCQSEVVDEELHFAGGDADRLIRRHGNPARRG